MTYELAFIEDALKEWKNLDNTVRQQFKKKLTARLIEPNIPSAKLSGAKDRYKIKLKASGYRLVYQINEQIVTVTVITVGKREQNAAYKSASKRL